MINTSSIFYKKRNIRFLEKFFLQFSFSFFVKTLKNNNNLAMLTAMDEAIGDLINYLKQLGAYENTVIIFSSDVSI